MIFQYPQAQSNRRHGPGGYSTYEPYRQWLRDEFAFRCVYCLKRERWGQVTGEFDLDHFVPQSVDPDLKLEYTNLIYACRRCNSAKRAHLIPSPETYLASERVDVLDDGSLKSNDPDTDYLIRRLDLNSPKLKSWRRRWMRIVSLAKRHDEELYFDLVGFPEDLPNLDNAREDSNTRREGVNESWFARRERGELPAEY